MVPLIGAMAFNPFAAVPVAFGVVFVKVLEYLKEAASLGDPGMDVQGIMTTYQYIFDKLIADKEMIVYIIVFTIAIVVAYAISRLSINYAWYIAIAAGTIVNVAGLAVMSSGIEGVSIGMVVVGSRVTSNPFFASNAPHAMPPCPPPAIIIFFSIIISTFKFYILILIINNLCVIIITIKKKR